jgi:serine/threonine protein kinase
MAMIGSTIDNEYRVEQVLGEGAFGIVYRCQEVQLKRIVALKMLNKAAKTERDLKRFMIEGRNLAQLNHPNVVHIYRLGSHEGVPYIVMEYLPGRTVRTLLLGPRLQPSRALDIMRQVASGLRAIHSNGIVHRDLSPNNIMVMESGQAKILDLGMAKDMNRPLSSSPLYLAGTIPYVAPEQIEGETATLASDIFSFGVMLYEMLAGRNPFQAEHNASILYNILNKQPETIDTYLKDCPSALTSLVDRCISKRSEDRLAELEDAERVLSDVLGSQDLESTQPRVDVPVSLSPRVTPSNPYLNRVMIKRRGDFFGRTQEVRRIYARLNATPPGSVSIVGDRKIGKSSLLNYIYLKQNRQRFLEQPEKLIMVFLDLQQEKGMSLESFVKILQSIAGIELRGRLDVSDCSQDLDGIKALVERLESHGFRLAILLDEFEAITTNRNFEIEFFSFLRFLANHYNVAYITSSARDLQVLCHTKEISDSPFFNIFSTMRLSAFRRQEAEDLIRVPSERVGKPLEAYADEILDMAGLFPFFIQVACSHMIEHLDEVSESEAPDLQEVRRRFYDEARLHFRFIWDNLSSDERSSVTRIARGKSVPVALRHVAQELARRHYVVFQDDTTRLFSETFRGFVQEEAQGQHGPSLLKRLLGPES